VDPKLWFWTGALLLLGAVVACGGAGVHAIRRGEVRRHRRFMGSAAAGVGLFLVAYAVKVPLLGREDRSAWTRLDYGVLYVHELCVAVMLLAGATALFQAWRARARIDLDGPRPALPGHGRAGRIAARAGLLAFLTAGGVWAGMLARAGAAG
jgi:uncharacterized membrane protein YozB (DUF420 family)